MLAAAVFTCLGAFALIREHDTGTHTQDTRQLFACYLLLQRGLPALGCRGAPLMQSCTAQAVAWHKVRPLVLLLFVLTTARTRCLPTQPAIILNPPHPAAYGLTLVWALVAVFEHTDSTPVHRTALAAIVVLAVLSVASVLRRPGARQPESSHDHEARQPLRPSLDER